MKRMLALLIAISLITPAYAMEASEYDEVANDFVLMAIQNSDIYYAPSPDPDDYSVDEIGTVTCLGEEVGYITSTPGSYSYVSVDKATPYVFQNTIIEGQRLDIPFWQQGSDFTCWAACCAMCITYRTGRTVTEDDILDAVTDGEQISGNWSMMQEAYTLFGLSVQQHSKLSFSRLQDLISQDIPIHIGGNRASDNVAHSMVMYGWGLGDMYDVYCLYDPFYDMQYMSIFVDDSSDYLSLPAGGLYVWKYSRY